MTPDPEPSAKELSERIAQLTDDERRSINDRLIRTSTWLITGSMQSLAGYRDLAGRLANAEADNAALRADKERMNQLEQLTVNVRQPLVHGSRDLFWASPTDDDGDEQPSDIRAQLDKLRATKPTQPSEMPTPRTDASLCGRDLERCTAVTQALYKTSAQLERDLSTLQKAAEAARVALEQSLRQWKAYHDGTFEQAVDEDTLDDASHLEGRFYQSAQQALASLRSELEKVNPATPETPAPNPG